MTRSKVSLILAVPLIAGILFFAAGLPLVNARSAWLSGDVSGASQALRWGRFGIRAADYNRARAAIALSDGNPEAANSALARLSGESAPWLPVFTKDVVGRKLLAAGKYEEFLRFDRAARDWQKTSEGWLIRSAAEAGMGNISGAQAAFGNVQAGDVERSRYEMLRTALAERADGVFPLLLDRNGTPIAEWNSKTNDLRATSSDFEAFVDRSGGPRTVESNLTAPLRQFTLELTLDPFVQRAALSALGTNRGSLVAIDTDTNEILAIANNGGDGAATDLALDGDYEPGSVIKVLTALNGVERGVGLSGFFPRECDGSLDLDGRIFHDWQRHGQIGDLNRALAVSCNVVFGELGLQIGKERLLSFMAAAGFGQTVDFGLLRAPLGRIVRPVEGPYDTASLAIGLEKERINALHVAILASMVANRGVMTIPRLVRSRRTILGDELPLPPGTPPRRIASDAAAAAVTEAMRAVVEASDGTGKRAAVSGFPIAMKTGTAGEGAHGFNSVILAFAAADRPRIAIGMISEHTGPAEFVGAKIAHDFFQSVGARFR
ncbi:MAG: penicillin-binding transpeptidase domain-containing protein [Acidobacteriota bacterium]